MKEVIDMFLEIYVDYERSAEAGAADCFQVISIIDRDTGKDFTSKINHGKHYFKGEEVISDLGLSGIDFEITS